MLYPLVSSESRVSNREYIQKYLIEPNDIDKAHDVSPTDADPTDIDRARDVNASANASVNASANASANANPPDAKREERVKCRLCILIFGCLSVRAYKDQVDNIFKTWATVCDQLKVPLKVFVAR